MADGFFSPEEAKAELRRRGYHIPEGYGPATEVITPKGERVSIASASPSRLRMGPAATAAMTDAAPDDQAFDTGRNGNLEPASAPPVVPAKGQQLPSAGGALTGALRANADRVKAKDALDKAAPSDLSPFPELMIDPQISGGVDVNYDPTRAKAYLASPEVQSAGKALRRISDTVGTRVGEAMRGERAWLDPKAVDYFQHHDVVGDVVGAIGGLVKPAEKAVSDVASGKTRVVPTAKEVKGALSRAPATARDIGSAGADLAGELSGYRPALRAADDEADYVASIKEGDLPRAGSAALASDLETAQQAGYQLGGPVGVGEGALVADLAKGGAKTLPKALPAIKRTAKMGALGTGGGAVVGGLLGVSGAPEDATPEDLGRYAKEGALKYAPAGAGLAVALQAGGEALSPVARGALSKSPRGIRILNAAGEGPVGWQIGKFAGATGGAAYGALNQPDDASATDRIRGAAGYGLLGASVGGPVGGAGRIGLRYAREAGAARKGESALRALDTEAPVAVAETTRPRAPRQVFDGQGIGNQTFEVVKNPSRSDLARMTGGRIGSKTLRFVKDIDGNTYVADADVAIHQDIVNTLERNGVKIPEIGMDDTGFVKRIGDDFQSDTGEPVASLMGWKTANVHRPAMLYSGIDPTDSEGALSRGRPPKANEADVANALREGGKNGEVARTFGISPARVSQIRTKHGIPVVPREKAPPPPRVVAGTQVPVGEQGPWEWARPDSEKRSERFYDPRLGKPTTQMNKVVEMGRNGYSPEEIMDEMDFPTANHLWSVISQAKARGVEVPRQRVTGALRVLNPNSREANAVTQAQLIKTSDSVPRERGRNAIIGQRLGLDSKTAEVRIWKYDSVVRKLKELAESGTPKEQIVSQAAKDLGIRESAVRQVNETNRTLGKPTFFAGIDPDSAMRWLANGGYWTAVGTAAAAGSGALGGGEAKAQQAPTASAERAKVAELEANAQRFESVNRSDPVAVRKAQEFLQSQGLYGEGYKPDGVWGSGTTVAVSQYLERNKEDLDAARVRLKEAEYADAAQKTAPDPTMEAVREWGPIAAFAAGALVGERGRLGAVNQSSRKLLARNAEFDALLRSPRAKPTARMAGVNEFWNAGGAGENVPFAPAKTQRGFKARPGAAPASSLFPPQNSLWRGNDAGQIGVGLAEAGGFATLLPGAHAETVAAQAAVDKDPSEANLVRLERAKNAESALLAAARLGAGYATGRTLAPFGHRYLSARPNVAAAETEAAQLNKMLAPKPRKKPAKKKP